MIERARTIAVSKNRSGKTAPIVIITKARQRKGECQHCANNKTILSLEFLHSAAFSSGIKLVWKWKFLFGCSESRVAVKLDK